MALAQHLQDLDAVIDRHVHVEDHELKVAAGAQLQGLISIGDRDNRETVRLQEVHQQLGAGGVVVGDQDAALHLAATRRSPPAARRNCPTTAPKVRVSMGLAM